MPRKKPGDEPAEPAAPSSEANETEAAPAVALRRRARSTAPATAEARAEAAVPQPGAPQSPQAEAGGDGQLRIPDVLPVLRTGASVLYPAIVVPLVTSDEADVRAVDEAVTTPERLVAVVAQQQGEEGVYDAEIQPIGTAAQIVRMAKAPNGTLQALIQGVARVRIVAIEQREPWLRARVERIGETLEPSTELEAMTRSAVSLFQKIVALSDQIPGELGGAVSQITHPGNLADFIAANAGLKPEDRQAVLAEANVTERLRVLSAALNRELEILEVSSQIQTQVRGDMDKRQREFILREQMRAIQKELGDDESHPEIGELRQKLDAAHLPEEVRKQADRELERLASMTPAAADYNVARTYLEWLADLPWDRRSEDQLDINEAQRILDADHYGLEKVKQRILDYLAVLKLRQDTRGPILCFVGPPGVGKTSLGHSIARATGRKFVRLSLGGVRDEAEIRGHRRTYVGALPGRIIQEMRRAGVNNPLMVLDEVDKLGSDYRGDPSSALLEVLDPAQNNTFTDHYLDVPFDLSHVMFITTANMLDTIPGPLLDRMEVIELPGYTDNEKREIARRYLLPRQIAENGLQPGQIEVSDDTLEELIDGFTREAGVRNLERLLGTICRHVARKVAAGSEAREVITPAQLPEIMGRPRFFEEMANEPDEIGVVTGLAATGAGGDVLFIEASAIPGKGNLTLTGKLGDVMQESARAALTYARSRAAALGVADDFFEKHDLHIHVPAGATPKDGPSAGVTMATAIVSAITRRPVHKEVAMTGEITLRGRVMPVGAIKQKVLAAHRAGCKTVCLPKDNEPDYKEVPEEVRSALDVHFAEHVDDVLGLALYAETREEQPRVSAA
ncbi:MAG TPA: endopeptidase La [Dehalococcoidia bacterium]|nr:endopeptidase La [Dehalococcoidia bacterium]